MATFAKFVSSNAGLDSTLRFVQSTALIVSSRTGSPEWTILFQQLDYVRRPLRMFGWLGCWTSSWQESLSSRNSLKSNLTCLKMAFLGLFLFTEMFVLPFSMQLLKGSLGDTLQLESFKFWAYALCFSIFSHLVTLWQGHSTKTPTRSKGKGKPVAKQSDADRRLRSKIWKDLMVDCCDLLIPAVTVGWVSMDSSLLGFFILVSTIGAGSDLWRECRS